VQQKGSAFKRRQSIERQQQRDGEILSQFRHDGAKNPRKLSLLPHEDHEWLVASRLEQRTPKLKKLYDKCAVHDIVGCPKPVCKILLLQLQSTLQRLSDFWNGELPALTRFSIFAKLGT
jgi:hypothetical protein